MADRQFDPYAYTLQKGIVELWAFIAVPTGTTPVLQRWQYGALGATPKYVNAATTGGGSTQFNKYAQGSEGFFSVARTNTGLWTLTLSDTYIRIMNVDGDHAIAGGTSNIVKVVQNPTITNLANPNQSIVGIGLLSATATLADPTAGATSLVSIKMTLQRASMP